MLLKNTFEMQIMKNDNNGVSLAPLNEKIQATVCDRFGGCTMVDSQGLWVDGCDQLFTDESYRMIVSFNRDKNTIDQLLKIIEMELIDGDQLSVCFTINGMTAISSSINEARDDLKAMLTPANQGRRVG